MEEHLNKAIPTTTSKWVLLNVTVFRHKVIRLKISAEPRSSDLNKKHSQSHSSLLMVLIRWLKDSSTRASTIKKSKPMWDVHIKPESGLSINQAYGRTEANSIVVRWRQQIWLALENKLYANAHVVITPPEGLSITALYPRSWYVILMATTTC